MIERPKLNLKPRSLHLDQLDKRFEKERLVKCANWSAFSYLLFVILETISNKESMLRFENKSSVQIISASISC